MYNKKKFEGTEKMWKNFSKPGLKIASPIISAGVVAKTKSSQSTETTNILKSLTGGKVLGLTDLHSGAGLTLRVM